MAYSPGLISIGSLVENRALVLLINPTSLEARNTAVANVIIDLYGITANLTVLNIFLAAGREVQHDYNRLPAVRTSKLIFQFHPLPKTFAGTLWGCGTKMDESAHDLSRIEVQAQHWRILPLRKGRKAA